MAKERLTTHAVILAGGRGTRFWPRSRTRTPKQLLNIIGKTTMLEQTVARLRPLIAPERIWTVTNSEQAAAVRSQLSAASRKRVLTESIGRNTAAAIALAAIHVRHAAKGDALLAVLPADHFISQPDRYRKIVVAALEVAREPGRMVVLGIPPTHPETGFGYVQRMGESFASKTFAVFAVRRFTEKPDAARAAEYVASGEYHWNAGMFFWRVSTFLESLERNLPKTYAAIESLSQFIGKSSYNKKLRAVYPTLENISVDCAILERETASATVPRVFTIPAEIGWSDIGSWAAVFELLAKQKKDNVFFGPGHALDAEGNFLWSPTKFIAAIGVHSLVVVETPDALLICPRDRAQDVGKLVRLLEEWRQRNLL